MFRKIFTLLKAFSYIFIVISFSTVIQAKEQIIVGVVIDGYSSAIEKNIALVNSEIQLLTRDEFNIRLPKEYQLSGEWKQKGIESALENLYQNPKVDIVLVLGYGSAVVAVNKKSFSKPTLVSTIIDERLSNAPVKGNTSGKHNLSYISIQGNLQRELKAFREVVDFKHIAMISDALMSEVMPNLHNKGMKVASKLDIKITPVKHNGGSIEDLFSKFPKEIDAVMIGTLPRMSIEQKTELLTKLIERGLPSYSIVDSELVEQGALMTTIPSVNTQQRARRIALNLQTLLLGNDLKDMKIFINDRRQLIINMQTAHLLHISPSFAVMLEAKKINEKENASIHWSLNKVADTALRENLSIKASKLNIALGEEIINESQATLLPQLSIGANHQFRGGYDSDAMGKQNGSASLSLSQILYSETAWSNLDIEKLRQEARISEHKQTELDVIEDATVKFLNVLKSQTLLDVQKENVKLSRINLELAQSKARIGTASKADIYRWESGLFTAKADLLGASSTLKQAKEALNQILNRPLDEPFNVAPALIDNPVLIMNDPELSGLIANRASFHILSKVLIELGLNASPEIATYIANIATEQRILKSENRSYYMPKATLNGDYSSTYYDSRNETFSKEGENDWSIGINLSLALYEGGARSSKVRQSYLTLKQLQLQLLDSKNSIEQKIRANLHATQVSKLSIDLQQASADSSKKNYELVYDAYSKGTAGIIDLVDAQNSGLTAKFNAVNATYQFLIDLMYLQRSIGNFDFFLSDDERQSIVQEIKKKMILGK
ncbi:TolC family protein [Sulfurimonas sp.]|uniref:TolC family protein n=1 Tax=Sulfurimonas sp. TaxID=2022749 RepID=UPI002B477AEE|nr:TolC family protein [Sulfurimonas sp.]